MSKDLLKNISTHKVYPYKQSVQDGGVAIIPYIMHSVWLTDPNQPIPMQADLVWKNIEYLNSQKEEDGVEWDYLFWTNVKSSVVLDEKICKGRCEIKVLDEKILPGYNKFKDVVELFIKNGIYSIDVVRVLVLWSYGGLYTDTDVEMVSSPVDLHVHFDFYIGLEKEDWIGVGPGMFASKQMHPILKTWMDLLEEFYGITNDNKYALKTLLPNPMECNDLFYLNGPRFATAAVIMSNNLEGNNDVIFQKFILNINP